MNSLFTIEKLFYTNSILEKKEEGRIENDLNSDFDEGIALNYLIPTGSIELKRKEIKEGLSKFFVFQDDNEMIDFLSVNKDVFDILPSLASYIFSNLTEIEKLEVSLLNESKNWKTIFIDVHSSSDWESTNDLSLSIYDILIEDYPNIFDKININFCQI